MSEAVGADILGGADTRPMSGRRIWTLSYLCALVHCFLYCIPGTPVSLDVDDQMRELQIRHLMQAPWHNWWDLTLPVISMPGAYTSPWSRLVDLPFMLFTLVFTPALGQEGGLQLAFAVWPPLMLGIFCLLSTAVLRRTGLTTSLMDHLVVLAAISLMVFAIGEYVPNRIDHHNMQFLSLMAILAGICRWDARGGVLAGLGAVVSVAIGLEGLPYVVVAFGGLIAALIAGVSGAAVLMRASGLAIICLTAPLALFLLGPSGAASTQCDAFSAPYVLLLTGSGAMLWLGGYLRGRMAVAKTLGVLAIAGCALLAATALLFPQCLSGPYWMIDPVSKRYWFDRVAQEHSILYFVQTGQFAMVILMAVLGLILAAATPVVLAARRRKPGFVIALLVAGFSLLLSLAVTRYHHSADAFVPLFLPLAHRYLAQWRLEPGRTSANRLVAAATGTIVLAAVAVMTFGSTTQIVYGPPDYMALDTCKQGDFSALKSVPPGGIIAPLGLALYMVPRMPDGFTVAALPFHRASPGIRRVFEAFAGQDAETRRQALAPFQYVAVCRFPVPSSPQEAPLYAALSAGRDWPGLVRVKPDPANPFQLFRIDHAALH